MQIEKKYYLVDSVETVNLLIEHINQSDVIAYDTETTGINVRKDKIVGWSISGNEGIGFYLPTLVWNVNKGELEEYTIGGKGAESISKKIYENENCVGFKNKETKVLVELVRSLFLPCESILEKFDFTIVKAAYYLPKGKDRYEFVYHSDFFEHLHLKKLVIDEYIEKPVATFNRALKYVKYGFGLCLESKQTFTREIIEREEILHS